MIYAFFLTWSCMPNHPDFYFYDYTPGRWWHVGVSHSL